MLKTKIILFIIGVFSIGISNSEQSKYYYIDSIDEIKKLEEIGNQYLNFGDTLNAIQTFIQITDKAQLSDIYSDIFISDYLYRIGDLYLLINDYENAEKYLLLSIDRHNQNKIKNQLLMGDPLSSLQKLYST